jgi:hypothetical protein
VRRQFQENRDLLNESERAKLLSHVFSVCRQINDCVQTASKEIPWLGGVPEPRFNNEPLVKLVPSPANLQPGMVLISHPLWHEPRETKKSVWLITGIVKGSVHVAALSGEWSRVGQKKSIVTTNTDTIQGKAFEVGDGIYYGEQSIGGAHIGTESRPVNVAVWSLADLSENIERGCFFLATCPLDLLFTKKTSKEGSDDDLEESHSNYDLSLNKNDDLWKKLLQAMGGECELCVYCVEKPPAQEITHE